MKSNKGRHSKENTKTSIMKFSALREVIPFFVVVTIVIIGLYVTALIGLEQYRTPWRIGVITVLMLAYLLYYWALLILPEKITTYIVFLVVQSVLAFVITLLTRQTMLSIGLFSPLIGVAVGSLRNVRWSTLAVLGILFFATLSTYVLPDSNIPTDWFWVIIPVTVFVVVYVEMYSRQSEARDESQRLLRELEIAHNQLSEYAAQLEDLTLANERQRLARELHDTLAQGLVGLILQLEAVSTHLEKDNSIRAQQIIEQAMSRARATLADARKAIGDLREMQVHSDDIVSIIQDEIERFTKATGIPCEFNSVAAIEVPFRIAEHVQRMVAEAMINIARHAQAQHVWVSLSGGSDYFQIEVRDDGVGFDYGEKTSTSGHYGLLGMRERVRLAEGKLEINSIPGKGTTVEIILPMAEVNTEFE